MSTVILIRNEIMKKKDIASFRSKKVDELKKLITEKKLETTKVWAEIKAGKEKNLKKVSVIKRDIAKLMTITREFEILKK